MSLVETDSSFEWQMFMAANGKWPSLLEYLIS